MGRSKIATNAQTTVVDTQLDWAVAFSRLEHVGGKDVYFRHDYSSLYATPNSRVEAFVFEDGDNILAIPYILRPIESDLPCGNVFDFESPYGYGGPLSTTSAPDFLEKAWAGFRAMCLERRMVAGFMRFHPLLDNHLLVKLQGSKIICDRQTITISLNKTADEVWHGYSPDVRNKIRKGQKLGVDVLPEVGMEALLTFSRLYDNHMEEIGAYASYFFGEEYFRAVHRMGSDSYRVYIARCGDEVLGGALVMLSPQYAHYHLSSTPYQYNRFATNTMLRHAVISDLIGSGRRVLHFGGGRTSDPEDSLLKFKSGFSKERSTFWYGTFVGDNEIYKQLCDNWAIANPDLVPQFSGHFLRYRY